MLIKLFAFLILITIFLLPTKVFADNNFDITNKETYLISDTGQAQVKQEVVIVNKTDFIYIPSYVINVIFSNIYNVRAENQSGNLKTNVTKKNLGNTIEVIFPKKLIGKGNKNKFTVTYTTDDIATKKKNGWEIVIPGISNPETFSNYIVDVTVPSSIGHPSIITPIKKTKEGNTYTFQKKDFSANGIYMLFKDVIDSTPKIVIRPHFPKNVIFGLSVSGAISIQNSSDEIIEDKTLNIENDFNNKFLSFAVTEIEPYETLVVPVDLGRTPFLTMDKFKVKISFDGQQSIQYINVGILPDLYLILLGGLITFGSIIVAVITWKTWRIYIQKRK